MFETQRLNMRFPVPAPTSPQLNAAGKPAVQQHSLAQSLSFHLIPGVLITLTFIGIAAVANRLELPASLALLTTWLVVGLPIELGILLYQGWRINGRPSLTNIVLYREPVPMRQYLWLVPILLIWTAATSTVLIPVVEALRQILFPWWPDWLLLSNFVENMGRYPHIVLWVMVILSFVLNITIPSVEELYFRGYLLPRMARWRKWAPLISVVLFSLYHFWLPWENPTRIIALLPLVYLVQLKRNIYVGIAVHCLLNTVGSLGLLVLVLAKR
jgi:membrane protease YdiL (CAAX protease family)